MKRLSMAPPAQQTGGNSAAPPAQQTGGNSAAPPAQQTGGNSAAPPAQQTGGNSAAPTTLLLRKLAPSAHRTVGDSTETASALLGTTAKQLCPFQIKFSLTKFRHGPTFVANTWGKAITDGRRISLN